MQKAYHWRKRQQKHGKQWTKSIVHPLTIESPNPEDRQPIFKCSMVFYFSLLNQWFEAFYIGMHISNTQNLMLFKPQSYLPICWRQTKFSTLKINIVLVTDMKYYALFTEWSRQHKSRGRFCKHKSVIDVLSDDSRASNYVMKPGSVQVLHSLASQ